MRGSAASLARTVPSLLRSRRDPRETAGAPRLSRRALVHLAGLFGRGWSGDGRVGLVRRGGFGVRGRLRWDQDGSGAGGRRSLGRGLASWALLGVGNEGSGQRRLVRSRLVGTQGVSLRRRRRGGLGRSSRGVEFRRTGRGVLGRRSGREGGRLRLPRLHLKLAVVRAGCGPLLVGDGVDAERRREDSRRVARGARGSGRGGDRGGRASGARARRTETACEDMSRVLRARRCLPRATPPSVRLTASLRPR